ncbi:PREDICTED: uncharacterized protein LOC108760928 [Trachymyrmex cornetzi]|uniref:uncharacterized protein LOC108760928 n=1 Tax=Trachymyrmex cornetzi TaxID=471704 RepID=UPI00084F32E7|nr:PREDICTED: uncharacterized protein LOC108760928 [Trachymyrmex cornetzi]
MHALYAMNSNILPQNTLNSPTALNEYLLTKGVPHEVLKILQDEFVDGEAFLSLTETDLKELKIKTGPRKRLLNLINAAKATNCFIVNGPIYGVQNNISTIASTTGNEIIKVEQPKNSVVDDVNNVQNVPILLHPQNINIQQPNNAENELNVRAWIEAYDAKHTRKVPLLSVLDSGIVGNTDRQEFIRIVCAEIVKLSNDMYPSSQLKTELAKEIVNAFPKLRSSHSPEGYEHFYDKTTNSGFIQYRFQNMRVKLSPTKKKRASAKPTIKKINVKRQRTQFVKQEYLDEEVFQEKCCELIFKISSDSNKPSIIQLLDETRPNRQRSIKNSEQMIIDDIFRLYPKLKDYNGEMIHREFISMFPNNDTFLRNFSSYYVPRILKFCHMKKEYLLQKVDDFDDDNFKALILLPELLPSPNYAKTKTSREDNSKGAKIKASNFSPKQIPNRNLLQFIHTMEDLLVNNEEDETLSQKPKDIQPFLVCFVIGQTKKGQFYIKTDENLISVGDDPIIAFDILVKLHYCFDVQFASDLLTFYDFITGCIMGLNIPGASCRALHTTLCNITL